VSDDPISIRQDSIRSRHLARFDVHFEGIGAASGIVVSEAGFQDDLFVVLAAAYEGRGCI
jgi:hypothetical protein